MLQFLAFAYFLLFSESVTTSDGYSRGYVSFAHFLLYFGYSWVARVPCERFQIYYSIILHFNLVFTCPRVPL